MSSKFIQRTWKGFSLYIEQENLEDSVEFWALFQRPENNFLEECDGCRPKNINDFEAVKNWMVENFPEKFAK